MNTPGNSSSNNNGNSNSNNNNTNNSNNNNNINSNGNNNSNTNNRFSISSIRLICDSAEFGQLTDEAALFMSTQVTQELKTLVKNAEKFCFHSKRRKLLPKDIDHALKVMNQQPILGFYCNDIIPFRFATGGGHRIYYHEDKEIDLADVIARVSIPKLPQEVSIQSHWLAIDGIQPAIPENPPPLTRDEQRLECIDPLETLSNRAYAQFRGGQHLYSASNVMSMEFGPDGRRQMIDPYGSSMINFINPNNQLTNKLKSTLSGSANTNVLKKHIETVQIKQLATHELSVEQQLYYKEITEACVGSNEPARHHALSSLAHDPGLHQMLPRLCIFISEGVKVNIVHNNLALIIYLMRMVKSLLDNPSLYLEKYLHDLCPTVITCIVAKQICNRPDQENHYALRDFASRLLASICRTYNTSTNCLQTRVTRLLCKALDKPNLPLSSMYGCIAAFYELGPEVQRTLLARRVKMIRDRLGCPSPSQVSRISPEGRILSLLAKCDLNPPTTATADIADEMTTRITTASATQYAAATFSSTPSSTPTRLGHNLDQHSR